jgi:DNA-binding SARP family transcriptional activator
MRSSLAACPADPPGQPHLRFAVLGPMTVEHGGVSVALPAGKPRALLMVLLLRANEVVSVSRLTEILWGARPPATARVALQNHVMRLRRQLGPCAGSRIKTLPPGYLVEVGEGELDLQEFLALRHSGRSAGLRGAWDEAAADLQAAMDLFGDELPEPAIEAPGLHDTEVAGLAEMGLQTLEWRIDADLHLGRHEELITDLRRLRSAYPARERLHEQLMLALYRSGRQAEALAAYLGARRWLISELGVEPGLALRRLHQRMLAADASLLDATTAVAGAASPLRAARPAQIPADLADFTGRGPESAQLTSWLTPDQRGDQGPVRVCGVTGAGGMGKTILAVHVANQIRQWYPDGQLYADLRGADAHPAPSGDVLARFLRELGVSDHDIPASAEERETAYRSLLAGKRMLILLDNAADEAQVRPLLPGAGRSAVLVTSRSRLAGLDGARILGLGTLGEADALALLAAVCGPDRVAADPQASRDVVAACAGLPLAIRIAAARLASRPRWSVRYFASRLADEQSRLDELESGDRAVRASFAVSYAWLPLSAGGEQPDLARAFRLLGTWDGPNLSLEAAAALLGEPPQATARVLERLVDVHLLESAGDARYRFHDLVRLYASERADEQESAAVRTGGVRRLLTWYLHSVMAATRALTARTSHLPVVRSRPGAPPASFPTASAARDWMEAERANLVTAVRQAAAHGLHAIAWQLPVYLVTFYDLRCYTAEWVMVHEIALDSVRQAGNRRGEAWVLSSLGFGLVQQERFNEAITHLNHAVELHAAAGSVRGQANALNSLGSAYGELGDVDLAVSYLHQALELRRRSGDVYGQAMSLANLAVAYGMKGEPAVGLGHAEQALALARSTGDLRMQGNALAVVGDMLRTVGRLDEAIATLRQAVAIEHETGNWRYEAGALDYLARALACLGRTAEARASWMTALSLLGPLGDSMAGQIRKELEALNL